MEEVSWVKPVGENHHRRLGKNNPIIDKDYQYHYYYHYHHYHSDQFDNPNQAEVEGHNVDPDEVLQGGLGVPGGQRLWS